MLFCTYVGNKYTVSNDGGYYFADASIDFLTHYQLVNPNKIEPYARAFVVEDDDKDGVVYPRVRPFFPSRVILQITSVYNANTYT